MEKFSLQSYANFLRSTLFVLGRGVYECKTVWVRDVVTVQNLSRQHNHGLVLALSVQAFKTKA
jgi:hypothetical protein